MISGGLPDCIPEACGNGSGSGILEAGDCAADVVGGLSPADDCVRDAYPELDCSVCNGIVAASVFGISGNGAGAPGGWAPHLAGSTSVFNSRIGVLDGKVAVSSIEGCIRVPWLELYLCVLDTYLQHRFQLIKNYKLALFMRTPY